MELEAQLYGGGPVAHVANHAALRSTPPSAARVFSDGALIAADAGGNTFTWFAANCTLNNGTGDSGWQIPALGGGCWMGQLLGAGRITPLMWECIGDGDANDTSCLQAAVTATETAGVQLWIDDGYHKYQITSTIVSTKTPDLEGVTGRQGGLLFTGGQFVCPSGIVVNSNVVALQILGTSAIQSSYIVRNICFQMGATPNTRGGGAAIAVGGVSGASQIGGILEGNTIINPYECVQVDSDTGGLQAGTQQIVLRDNICRDPTIHGIVWGRNTVNDSTSGTLDNNMVACGAVTGSNALSVIAYDGDFDWDGKNNGVGDCKIGFQITPGTINS
jgi:hypothetical protein